MSANAHSAATRLCRGALFAAVYLLASSSLSAFAEEQVLELLWEHPLARDSIHALAVAPNGDFVAFSNYDRVGVLDASGREVWARAPTDIGQEYLKGLMSGAVASNGVSVLGGNRSYYDVLVFEPDGVLRWRQRLPGVSMVMRLSPDESRIAVCAAGVREGDRLHVLNLDDGNGWSSAIPKVTAAASIEFGADGSRILVTGAWGGLSVFRSGGGCLWSCRTEGSKKPGYEWQGGSVSADGQTIAVCSRIRKSPRGLLTVYDGRGKKLWTRHCFDLWDPCVTPDGELIVTCLRDHDWPQDAGAELPEASTVPSELVAFTRDGRVAWRAEAGCHRVWMSRDGSLFAAFWPTDDEFGLRLFDRSGRLQSDFAIPGKRGQGITSLTRLRYVADALPRFAVWCSDKHIRMFDASVSQKQEMGG